MHRHQQARRRPCGPRQHRCRRLGRRWWLKLVHYNVLATRHCEFVNGARLTQCRLERSLMGRHQLGMEPLGCQMELGSLEQRQSCMGTVRQASWKSRRLEQLGCWMQRLSYMVLAQLGWSSSMELEPLGCWTRQRPSCMALVRLGCWSWTLEQLARKSCCMALAQLESCLAKCMLVVLKQSWSCMALGPLGSRRCLLGLWQSTLVEQSTLARWSRWLCRWCRRARPGWCRSAQQWCSRRWSQPGSW